MCEVCSGAAYGSDMSAEQIKEEDAAWCPETTDHQHTREWHDGSGSKCAACGLLGEDGWFPDGDPRDADFIGGYRPGIEGD